MLKRIILTGVVIMCTISVWAKHNGDYINKLTTKFKTPHLEWASKLKGGKIKTLFIVARKGARDAVEVAERMELELNAVNTVNAAKLAVENMYESAVDGTTIYEKKQELITKLDKKYNLYVIGNFDFDNLPAEAKYKILSQVKKGAGLVFVYPRRTKLKKLFANPVQGASAILALAAKAGLPKKIKKLSDSTLLKTYQFGKGRIAVLDYKANHGAHYGGQSLSVPNEYSQKWQAEFENNMVLIMRTMKWAAKRGATVNVSCPVLIKSPSLTQKKQTIDLNLNSNSKFKGTIKLRLRDEFNAILKRKAIPCDFAAEIKETVEIPFLSTGEYYLDIIVEEKGGVDNLGYLAFRVDSPIKPVLRTTEVITHNGPIKATLKLNQTINGTVEVTLADSPYGRIWFRKSYKLNGSTLDLNISDYYMPTIAGYLKCAVKQNGATVAIAEQTLFFPNHKLENYLQMVWDSVPGEYMGRIQSRQIVDMLGWRAGLNHPSKDGKNARVAALLNQRFVPYITRIGLTKGKKGEVKQYSWFCLKKSDMPAQKALNGDESFSRPEVKKLWATSIKNRITNLPKYGPALYNLGDENHFSYDAGFGPSDLKGFREFLKKKYGSISKLNREWGSKYTSFDVVPHYTLKEAKEKKVYPAWYDHRRYMEKMYADLHHFLAAEIKKYDPEAKVGAEGSVPGDLEETIDGLEFWGPYSNLVMDEVLRSIGGDRVRMLWWGGYVGSHGGRGEYPMPLWKDLLTGNVNGSAWFSGSNASGEGILGSDLDFADYAKTLIPYLNEMRNGVAQLLNTTPLRKDGIAVLWSHASDSARLLDPKFVNPRDSIGTFIKFCYKNGLNFDFITESMIEGLDRYKVVCLFGATCLSEKETIAIKRFVENGGTVIADMNPAIANENLRTLDNNPLKELFGNITYKDAISADLGPINLETEFKGIKLRLKAEKANMIKGGKLFTARHYGKGDSVLLNFTFASAKTTSAKDASFNQFLLNTLRSIGITPSATIAGINLENSILRIREGDGFTIVGLLADKKDTGRNATITLPEKAYVYATNKGYIDNTRIIERLQEKPLELITCFAKRQSPPNLKLSRKSIAPGVALDIDLTPFNSNRVLFLRIIGPGGKPLSLRDKVIIIAKDAKTEPVHFAFNDPKGNYTLVLKDVATGLKTQKDVVLK